MEKTVAFICPPLQGHINPMCAIAHGLQKRNLDIKFIGVLDGAKHITEFEFIAIGRDKFPKGKVKKITRKMSKLKGMRMGRVWQKRFTNKWSDVVCRELPQILDQEGIDYIVCDQMEAAVALVADYKDIPFISVCNAMAIVMDLTIPPFFTSWDYNVSERRLRIHEGFYKVADILLKHDTRILEKWRKKWKMKEREGMKRYFAVSDIANLSQQTKSLEFPFTEINEDWYYLGPFRNGALLPYIKPDLPNDGKKNVYISLGSLQGSRYKILKKCAEACNSMGLRPIIVHAGLLQEKKIEKLKKIALVHDYLKQPDIFEDCEVLISHCGLNTALDALSYGRPIVAIPIGIEQGAIATKLKRAGCAIILKRLRKRKLKRALSSIISDSK